MRPLVSEEQAERAGRQHTGGEPGRDFTVFCYRDRASNLTLFGFQIAATKQIICKG